MQIRDEFFSDTFYQLWYFLQIRILYIYKLERKIIYNL